MLHIYAGLVYITSHIPVLLLYIWCHLTHQQHQHKYVIPIQSTIDTDT